MRRGGPRLLLALYLILLALIAFWPTHVDRPFDGSLEAWLRILRGHGGPSWVDYAFVESASNVLLFIPFGLLIALILPVRRWWLAILIGFGTSCCIELAQLLVLSARTATMADVAANTLGAVIGVGVARVVRRPRTSAR